MSNLIILIFVIIVGSALFSGLEAAIFAISLAQAKILKEQKKKGADALVKIKEKMSRPITVIVVFNNITNIVGSIFVGVLTADILGSTWLGGVSAVLTFLIIIFGEIIPKTIGENYAEKITLRAAKPLLFMTTVFSPLVWMLEKITDRFATAKKIVSEEELQILSQLGHLEGTIEEDERDMIKKVFELNDLSAKDIMTPRTVVVSFPKEKTLSELEEKIYNLPNARIPVYSKNLDNVIGVCQRRDLLTALARDNKSAKISEFIKPAIYVKESAKADELLPLFQRKRYHLAIVKDEFGGTSGVVTLEDVLEQLVGEIVDETDKEVDMRIKAKEINGNNKTFTKT
jgi:CBS domain containing-hemolysin-like protein